jgi:hypothetical protein
MPQVYKQLRAITTRLERHYKDLQDCESTIQEGNLYRLPTRVGKRTGKAAARIAVDMAEEEGLIRREEGNSACRARTVEPVTAPRPGRIDGLQSHRPGLPVSPGAAMGRVVFSAADAAARGKTEPVVLARRNRARRHPWNGSGCGSSHRARRHDFLRRRGYPRYGQALHPPAVVRQKLPTRRRYCKWVGTESRRATGFRSMARSDG